MEHIPADPFEPQRRRMVVEQLAARGIRNRRILEAMRRVPRHRFVPEDLMARSYDDRPLPIGGSQTISQPFIVALMTEHLQVQLGSKILEVGTGTGYQSAVLATLGARVYTVERIPEQAESARRRLQALGYPNITVRIGDGSLGWPEQAPFDGIIVTAYAPEIPEILARQLAEGGRMVLPVGQFLNQTLVVAERREGKLELRDVCGCLFVPLIGQGGWLESEVDPDEQPSP